jgi:hypothetical protein
VFYSTTFDEHNLDLTKSGSGQTHRASTQQEDLFFSGMDGSLDLKEVGGSSTSSSSSASGRETATFSFEQKQLYFTRETANCYDKA